MKLKLDENLALDLANSLAAQGFDVDTVIQQDLGGSPDAEVVQAAGVEDRMLLTLDRGVGDLRRFPPGSHAGVVVLRPESQDPASIHVLTSRLVGSRDLDDFAGCVIIVDPLRIRVRRPEQDHG